MRRSLSVAMPDHGPSSHSISKTSGVDRGRPTTLIRRGVLSVNAAQNGVKTTQNGVKTTQSGVKTTQNGVKTTTQVFAKTTTQTGVKRTQNGVQVTPIGARTTRLTPSVAKSVTVPKKPLAVLQPAEVSKITTRLRTQIRPSPGPSQAQSKSGPKSGASVHPLRESSSVASIENKPAKRSKKLFSSPKGPRKKPANQGSQDSVRAGSSESMLSLQDELQNARSDKLQLEKKVDKIQQEYHQQVLQLQKELAVLQKRSMDVDQANSVLRARLHDVAHSPLSDSEKHELLQQHNTANPINMDVSTSSDNDTMCAPPDWDNKSGSSEVSVACLQDRILQMEETHYSTNEELQATLQELADLQTQLTDLHSDNERLADEKNVLLESLCQQTSKLEDSRAKVDTLQELLLREGQGDKCTEREQKLVALLKSAQEEREALLGKQETMGGQLHATREAQATSQSQLASCRDRVALLEATVDAAHEERAGLDRELACAKQDSSSRQIEISRLATLLENARAKIEELEAAREVGDRTEMEQMLDAARREKDQLEGAAAAMQEQLSRSQAQASRLQEQLQHLQEECKVTRNNAKSQLSDLEYRCDNLLKENQELSGEVMRLQETTAGLQDKCQSHLEDKRQLKSMLSERQRDLTEAERRFQEQGEELTEERKLRQEETEEWSKFQSDLLMAVRVANDFKTEAQTELEKLVLENKSLRDKVRSLGTQLDRQKAAVVKPSEPPALRTPTAAETTVLTSVQQELTVRRQKAGISRQDSRLSVKSLIDSIENAAKLAKNSPGSRSSSTSSLSSIASGAANPNSLTPQSPTSEMIPLREQQNKRNILSDNVFKSDSKRDDENAGVSIFSNKSSYDFGRRNSQPDISERKDPLTYLVKNGGSKRNALLKWCQHKTVGYRNIDITNFSSSWNDGLALCAILHTYLPERVPYDTLTASEKRRNFTIAFAAAESVGVPTTLNVSDMIQLERPDWQQVIAYVTDIYRHFET